MALTAKRLRRLLAYREQLERLQEARLAEANRRRAEREAALASTLLSREALFAGGAPASGPVAPEELQAVAVEVLRLEREVMARSGALAHSEREVEAERSVLLERRRERRAIETLLERLLAAERRERQRREALRLDELAGIGWVRGTRTTGDAA